MRLLLALSLCLLIPARAQALSLAEARHLLVRTGFHAAPAEVDALRPLDRAAAVARILDRAGREAVTPPPDWTRDWRPPKRAKGLGESERRARRKERRRRARELKAWWLREIIHTPTPVTEVMTLFWHNHFTSGLRKVKSPGLMYRQNVLLRRHGLGNFGELLRRVARDPAMLLYLDGARNRREAPNENFARELFELFTLGEGHYTERDVKEAARAFTGWSLDRRTGEFMFRRRWHDDGAKSVLGRSGRLDGDDVIEILLARPRTAEHVVEKLWRGFVSEAPPPGEVRRLAALFRQSGYEIKPLLAALLASDAFYDSANRGRLIKSPVDLLAGTVRQFRVEVDAGKLARLSRRLGQDLFDPPNVKGWPGGTRWVTSATLVERQAVLGRLAGTATEDAMDRPARQRRAARWAGHFDAWAEGMAGPWASAEGIVTLLLPLPPVDGPVLDREGSGALVRRLLVDPVYQLK